MSINISFGGAKIQRPGAYSTVDTSNMTPVGAGGFKVLACIGVPNAVNSVYATAQVVQNTVTGTISSAGNATVVVTAAGMANSPKTFDVPVTLSDTAAQVASKIVAVLQADTDVTDFCTVANNSAVISLTAKLKAANDSTMAITIANGTCTGLTASNSATSTAGIAGGVKYYNDPIIATADIGSCKALEMMKIAWSHGADLIAFSAVAQTAQDSDWQNAVDILGSEPVDGFIVASNSSAINAKVKAHCVLMSTVSNRKERRFFAGHAVGVAASTDAVAALQAELASELVVLATPGVYSYDSNGNKVLRGSEYLAAAYAGTWAGQESQEPITYKYVSFPGLEKVYSGTEIDALLAAHVAPTEYVRNKGFRIVQGITTSAEADLTKSELSVSTTKVEMNQTIRTYMEDKYVGKAGVAGIEVTIYNDLVSLIEGFLKQGKISGYDKASVSVTKSGTTFILNWQGTPTLPINNFLLTSHLSL